MLTVWKQPNKQRGFFCPSHRYKVKLVGNKLNLAFTTNIYKSSLIFQLNSNEFEHFLLMFCNVKKLPCMDKSLALLSINLSSFCIPSFSIAITTIGLDVLFTLVPPSDDNKSLREIRTAENFK